MYTKTGDEEMIKTTFRIMLLALAFGVSASVLAQGNRHNPDDVAVELIGQVTNPSATSSFQNGYLSYVNGIDSPLFGGSPQNETTALFTFYSDTVTTRVINNGSMRIINREGTFAVYSDSSMNGNFADPATFRDGQQIMTADLRHQVIVDTVTGAFTTTFVLTIVSSDPFEFDGKLLRFGKIGDKLRLAFQGHLNSAAPPAGYIAGNIVGNSLVQPEK